MRKPSPQNPFHDLTDEVREEVRTIMNTAGHAALATLSPETGYPMSSRANIAIDAAGAPFVFISALSAHTLALKADRRCSILVGAIGKGDALAHPRVTVFCDAELIGPISDTATQMRTIYLKAHPKAGIYIDLPDFRFFRLAPVEAMFNGGFGRAYKLSAADFAVRT